MARTSENLKLGQELLNEPALDTIEELIAWKANRCGQHVRCMEIINGCDCTCTVCCNRRASLVPDWR